MSDSTTRNRGTQRAVKLRPIALLFLVLAVGSAQAAGCDDGPDEIDGLTRRCDDTDDCVSGYPYLPGTRCVADPCVCRSDGFIAAAWARPARLEAGALISGAAPTIACAMGAPTISDDRHET